MAGKPTYKELEQRVKELEKQAVERKQDEEALRESEEKYCSLVESTEDSIYLVDRECGYLFMNKKHLSRFDLPPDKVIGRAYGEFHSEEETKEFTEKIKKVIKTGKSLWHEYRSERDGGYYIRTLSPVKDRDGNVRVTTVISKDITERKRAEDALRESEASYRELADSIADLFFAMDKELRYTYWNKASENLMGIPAEDAIGKSLYELFPNTSQTRGAERVYLEVLRKQKPRSFVIEYQLGGKDFIFEISAYPSESGLSVFVKDITDRKRAEEALRESEEKYRDLYDNAPVMYHTIDTKGIVLDCNQTEADMLGYSKEEIIGKPIYTFQTKKYQDLAPHALREGMEKGHVVGERCFVRKDGRIIDTAFEAMAIHNDSGKVVGFRATVTDITHVKQAEEALRESEEKYRSLVESTEDSICLVDRECGYLFMNKKHLSRFDLPPDKVIGRAYGEFHSERETREFKNKVNEVLETGKSLWHEYRSERDGGYSLRTLSPVKEPDGRTAAVTVVSKDITDRKLAETALEREKERFRVLVEESPLGACLISEDGSYNYINLKFLEMFGYSIEDIPTGREWFRKAYPDKEYRKEVISTWIADQKESKVGEARPRTFTVTCKDGSEKVIGFRPVTMETGEQLVICEDITERKKSEEELERSREELRNLADHLQSVREVERTTIAREIHDELGQSLTALKMDISWLGKRLPKDQETLLEKTKAMSKLTDSTIKTVKRISTELRPGLLDDLGLVAAIEWQAEEFQNRTGIRCGVTTEPEEIILDRDGSTTIFRIFQETLTNVARHAKATMVKVSLKEKAGTLELKVRDNGKGITKKQISNPKSFGLMGIRERVHPWGGKVKITGKPGKGTTVMVRIPLDKEGEIR